MKFNLFAVVTAVLATVFCVVHFYNALPTFDQKTEIVKKSSSVDSLTFPSLDKTVAEQAFLLFKEEKKQVEVTPKKASKPKVKQRSDEIKIDGLFLRLVAVYDSETSTFAVIEQRDSESGVALENLALYSDSEFKSYRVSNLTLSQITLVNNQDKIVFEMYKKPRKVKG